MMGVMGVMGIMGVMGCEKHGRLGGKILSKRHC